MLVAQINSSSAIGPTSGGKLYAFNNISTTPSQICPASPQRASITFINPGSTVIFIAPTVAQAINSIPASISNVTLTPNTSALGGCFILPPNGGSLTLTGECQGTYQAFSASGTGNPLTVVDSNVP